MLENLRELAAFPGMPRARQRPAIDFFRDLEANSGPGLPTWNGELYLELHRGTYTTQSRNKRANRKSEFLLHDAEFLATLAARVDPGRAYPAATFTEAWKLVCLNQFHDIIPGSSIGAVYADSQKQYAEIGAMAGAARDAALATIAARTGGDVIIANPTSFSRRDPAWIAGPLPANLERADGTPVAIQTSAGGAWIDAGEIGPYSVVALRAGAPGLTGPNRLTARPDLLENERIRVELNPAGDITRIYDKVERREVLPAGAIANQLQAFEDRPMFWEAWDVDIFFDDRMWLAEPAESVTVAEAGPLKATLEIRRRILNSSFVQRISITRDSSRLDIETRIDWRERHILLKAAFPADVLSPVATHDIQWGNVQRPTHRNTSWDWARFETCAHKWVDLSEGGYGVSVLNDCKYGHDVRDNVIRISLLRSPTSPDPEADQGEHRFSYSLLPHAGGWEAGTPAEAYALNDPLIAAAGSGEPLGEPLPGLVSVDAPNVVIETIKQAEDGNGVIVRLYESQRRRGPVTLTAGFPMADARRCNLLEETQAGLAPAGNRITFQVKPFEIVTMRLIPA
jgi:alpha-mannosidase